MNEDYDALEKEVADLKAAKQRAVELLRTLYKSQNIFNFASGAGPQPWHETGLFLAEINPEIAEERGIEK